MMKLNLATLLMLTVPMGAATATFSCVSSKKPEKEQLAKLEKYVVEAPPKGITKLDVNLGDKITLLGYTISHKGTVKPGQRISYKLYWKSEKALGQEGWRLFTHVLNSKNHKLINIDNVGPLRNNGKKRGQAFPPSKWQAGKVYVDEQTFKVPKSADGDLLKIVTGVWKGKNRLEPKSGPHISDNRALVATLNVGKKQASNTRVPSLRVDKLSATQKIKIDGKLDEAAWADAPSTGEFVNVRTGNADPKSPVQGQAKLLWDEKSLYVAFEVKDEDVIGGFKKTDKDPHLWTKDTVEIMIDPDGDGDNKDYYEIQVNPQNLVFDSRFDSYNKPKGGENGPFGHQDWSSKLKSAVVIDGTLDKSDDKDKGYTVEIELPWSSFDKAKKTPPELGQKWRINLYAMQDNGGVAWSPILNQGNFHKASRFGRVLWAEKGWVDPKAKKSGMKADHASLKAGEPKDTKAVLKEKQADDKSAAPTPKPAAEKPKLAAPKATAPKPAAPKATTPAPVAPKKPAAPKPAAPAPAGT